MKKQSGAALVEFAGVALVFFMIVFGIIEFARAFFIYNTLIEATRRGARVAAICPPNDEGKSEVRKVVSFDGNFGFLGLEAGHVTVLYCFDSGCSSTYPDPETDPAKKKTIDDIGFVNVSIDDDYADVGLIIPGVSLLFPIPDFSTTLPAESLGRQTPDNPLDIDDRQCIIPP